MADCVKECVWNCTGDIVGVCSEDYDHGIDKINDRWNWFSV